MSGNYTDVDGVEVSEWGPESEVMEPDEAFTGELEEMYVDCGKLAITIVHPDGETVTDIRIPILARNSWDEFVESLPKWR